MSPGCNIGEFTLPFVPSELFAAVSEGFTTYHASPCLEFQWRLCGRSGLEFVPHPSRLKMLNFSRAVEGGHVLLRSCCRAIENHSYVKMLHKIGAEKSVAVREAFLVNLTMAGSLSTKMRPSSPSHNYRSHQNYGEICRSGSWCSHCNAGCSL